MPGPAVPPEYVREAGVAAKRAVEHLTPAGQRCQGAAQAQSRQLDDNHVGTELAQAAAAADGGEISPRHLMLGVVAESRDWRQRGFDRPHHLEEAATAAGTSLPEIESILLRP